MIRVNRMEKHAAVVLQFAIFAVGGLSEDVLKFRNGQILTGMYLGGDPRQIRFVAGDALRTFLTPMYQRSISERHPPTRRKAGLRVSPRSNVECATS